MGSAHSLLPLCRVGRRYTGPMTFRPAAALLAATLLAALLAHAATAAPSVRVVRGAPTAMAPVPGEVIVKFKPGAALTRQYALTSRSEAGAVRSVLAERANAMGTRLGRTLQAGAAVGTDIQVLRASDMSAAELAARLAADPDVEFAEPN